MTDTTQLKNFTAKGCVIPVLFTIGVSGEELELQSIHDSNDSFFDDITNLFDFGIRVRERRVSSCSEDGFLIVDGVLSSVLASGVGE